MSILTVLDEFEAVPVLSIKHVAALIFFLDPLAAVMEAAVRVGVLRAIRMLFPALLFVFFQNWKCSNFLLARA